MWQRWPAAGADAWRCGNVAMCRDGALWVVSAEASVSPRNAEKTTILVRRACPSAALEEMRCIVHDAQINISKQERKALASLPWEGL